MAMTVKGLGIATWVLGIVLAGVVHMTISENVYDSATERICRVYASENGLVLTDWEGPGYKTNKYPGNCVFHDPVTEQTIYLYDSDLPRDLAYHAAVFGGTATSVMSLALALGGIHWTRKKLGI